MLFAILATIGLLATSWCFAALHKRERAEERKQTTVARGSRSSA
jgi:hypothetical protein